ncbi:MAG: glycogen debranching enzyme N-terminal domain-containing protein [Marinilabiliaceae bacterium]|nr:glycogen debranching enzyme N-terminal domain-containing protein [Marinilabiliaceae bacterium]
MIYFQLDKSKLINLEYSLFREILRTNRAGAYSSTTIIGCNTRKYHGLLVCPLKNMNYERHVLLSNVDVSVVQHDKVFNLGIHKYRGNHYEPKGHKYIRNFEIEDIPKLTFRVGGVVLSMEMLLSEKEEQVLLRYTLDEANSPTLLRFKPYLAFRSVHRLTHENLQVNTKYNSIENGIQLRLYDAFPDLNMQINKPAEFVPNPDWYRDIEYIKEYERGYEYHEDLYVPGYFEVPITKGESIVFSASTNIHKTTGLKAKFTKESNKRIPRDTLLNNLLNSAQQFLVIKDNKSELIAGYHWYGVRLRDTLISLPGLTLYQSDQHIYKEILEKTIKRIQKEYLIKNPDINQIDVPLWLFWTLKECAEICKIDKIWSTYGSVLKDILNFYRNPKSEFVKCLSNDLIYAKREETPLTWMDSMCEEKPVIPRYGMPVELNALWYNAICYAVEQAEIAKDFAFVAEWSPIAQKVSQSFLNNYWLENEGYLADCIDNDIIDKSIRSNQLFAIALNFSPLNNEQQKSVLDIIKKELLTPKGLRTLSPSDPSYKGIIINEPFSRDRALHQGCVWPWLFGFFADAYLNTHKKGGLAFIKRIMEGFDEEMYDHCLGTIPEFYTGTPPHVGKGAVSMAWNVAAILKVIKLIEKYS